MLRAFKRIIILNLMVGNRIGCIAGQRKTILFGVHFNEEDSSL